MVMFICAFDNDHYNYILLHLLYIFFISRFFYNRKARRKEKDSGTGTAVGVGCSISGTGSPGANEEGKLYLESALLERHLRETDLKRLVKMPVGIEENEWMASQSTLPLSY